MAWPDDTRRLHNERRSMPPGLNLSRATARVKPPQPVTNRPTYALPKDPRKALAVTRKYLRRATPG